MPLNLVPPRPGKSPYWYVRGTHRGVYVERSTRRTSRAEAEKVLRDLRRRIDRGELASQGPSAAGLNAPAGGHTVASAVRAYLQANGDDRFLEPIVAHFLDTPLAEIDQAAIDACAAALYPDAGAATRNRQVYTPLSAVMRHVGHVMVLHRPKGADGQEVVAWLEPEEAERLIEAATAIDAEFGAFLTCLCFTGLRLSEALSVTCADVHLSRSTMHVARTKTATPRPVHLPPTLVATLANHPRGLDRGGERLWRFRKSGRLYTWLRDAAEAAGVTLPRRSAFHLFRHTYATWMRRYAGLDLLGLRGTGAWSSMRSVARYAHVIPSAEARRADALPAPRTRAKSGE